MTLVDTSVWIEHSRAGPGFVLQDWIDFDEVVTCWPVIQEVLQGFDDERAYAIAHDAMTAMRVVESPLDAAVFEQAVGLYRTGNTVTP